MNNTKSTVFHLAIPTHDLDAAEEFYTKSIGAIKARRYQDRITFNFFGDQVVCHLAPEKIDKNPEMYPRHFGLTFIHGSDFDKVYELCKIGRVEFFKDLFWRFEDKPERHRTFFVVDPSNNLLEFKHYEDSQFVY